MAFDKMPHILRLWRVALLFLLVSGMNESCLGLGTYSIGSRSSEGFQVSLIEQEQQQSHIVELDLGTEAALKISAERGSDFLRMTDANGAKYLCYGVPDQDSGSDIQNETSDIFSRCSRDPGEYSLPDDDDCESLIKKQFVEIEDVCKDFKAGYWTYRFCMFQNVTQIHIKNMKKKNAFSLGKYAGAIFERKSNDKGQDSTPIIIQRFVNGSSGRESRVLLECDLKTSGIEIVGVEEPKPKSYIIRARTAIACQRSEELRAVQILHSYNDLCVRRQESLWTYELCFNHHVRQFHGKSGALVLNFILGKYADNTAQVWANPEKYIIEEKSMNQLYVQQTYTNGTNCDIRDEQRSTTVLYTCNRNLKRSIRRKSQRPVPVIYSVNESPTCMYEMKVHVPSLCDHPLFQPQRGMADVDVVNPTTCVLENNIIGKNEAT